MIRDPSKVRACGPWVYIRRIDPGDPYSLDSLGSGLYFPTGTGEQRVACGRGQVISAGKGCEVGEELVTKMSGYEEGDFAAMPQDIVPGAVVSYRGYLEGANQLHQWEWQDYCFIHMSSVLGVWEGITVVEKDGKLVEVSVKGPKADFVAIDEVSSFTSALVEGGPIVRTGMDLAKK